MKQHTPRRTELINEKNSKTRYLGQESVGGGKKFTEDVELRVAKLKRLQCRIYLPGWENEHAYNSRRSHDEWREKVQALLHIYIFRL